MFAHSGIAPDSLDSQIYYHYTIRAFCLVEGVGFEPTNLSGRIYSPLDLTTLQSLQLKMGVLLQDLPASITVRKLRLSESIDTSRFEVRDMLLRNLRRYTSKSPYG